MATYFARKTGNINASDVWATTPSGTAAAVTFASGEILVANSFTITVNVSTDLGGTGQLRNDTTGGATGGGTFTLSDGITLTANIFGGTTGTTNCVTANPTTGQNIYIVGNITGGNAGLAWGLNNSSGSGTINLTGNVNAGTPSVSAAIGIGLGAATLLVSGNVNGGAFGAGTQGEGIRVSGAGSCTVTGNVTGGGTATAYGIRVTGTGNITVAAAIGGVAAPAINNESTGQVTVTRAVGNGFGGGSVGLSAAFGVSNVANQSSITIVEQIEFGTLGQSPVNGRIRLKKANTNVATFNFCDSAGAKTLIDATTNAAMPSATDVRSGVSYASGALTGSCAVPAAGSTALGVPVDAGFGTAVLTPQAVWGHATRTITEGGITAADVWSAANRTITGGTVTTLTNAPASVTPADIWSHATRTITGGTVDTLTNSPSVPSAASIAAATRSELAVELARVDASISSRLAGSAYTAPANSDVAAIKAKTDALPSDPADQSLLEAAIAGVTAPSAATVASAVRSELTTELAKVSALNSERLNNCATTAIVGNLLAQANS